MRPSTGAPEHSRLSGGWEEVHTDSGGVLIARVVGTPTVLVQMVRVCVPVVSTLALGGLQFHTEVLQSMLISM